MTEFRLLASRKTFVGFVMGQIILSIFYLSFFIDNFHHGTELIVFGQQQDQNKEPAENYTIERSWGSKGAGDGQFMNPHSLVMYISQILVTIGSRNFLPMVRCLKNGDQKVIGMDNSINYTILRLIQQGILFTQQNLQITVFRNSMVMGLLLQNGVSVILAAQEPIADLTNWLQIPRDTFTSQIGQDLKF